jgi:enoyl-CoA hydratase
VLSEGPDLPLTEALERENRAFVALFDTEDQTEGMRAFLEKRPPRYQGR